jgi:hypothetical protein
MAIDQQESAARTQFARDTIRGAAEVFRSDDHVRARLGELSTVFADLSESVFFPKVHTDGTLRMDWRYRNSDRLAVVAVEPGEPITLSDDFGLLSITQRTVLEQTVTDWEPRLGTPEEWSGRYQSRALAEAAVHPKTVALRPGDAAEVTYYQTAIDIPENGFLAKKLAWMQLLSRQVVLLDRTRPISAVVVGHEYGHAIRNNRYPIRPIIDDPDEALNRQLRTELEMYQSSSAIAEGLSESGVSLTPGEQEHILVEYLRAEANVGLRDPFAPSRYVKQLLEANGLTKIYIPPQD